MWVSITYPRVEVINEGEEDLMAKKIYIIDDDRDMVDILSTILTSRGYEVAYSYSAKEATEKVYEVKPDLIVLDVMFPENSSEGFDLARAWSRDSALGNIPIIILSAINEKYRLGFSNKDIDEDWLPVSEFLEKPVEPDKFLGMVERLLNQ